MIELGNLLRALSPTAANKEGNCGLCAKCLVQLVTMSPIIAGFNGQDLISGASRTIYCQDCQRLDCPKSDDHNNECIESSDT